MPDIVNKPSAEVHRSFTSVIAQALLDGAIRLSRNGSVVRHQLIWRSYYLLMQCFCRRSSVQYAMGSDVLTVPATAGLPSVLSSWPQYNQNVERIASAVFGKYPGRPAVDLGANIGDTAVLIKRAADVPILCIEPFPEYANICAGNVARWSDVQVALAALSDRDGEAVSVAVAGGSAQLVSGDALSTMTLATLLRTHDAFAAARFIKIDVDGFDARVLQGGARGYASSARWCYGNAIPPRMRDATALV